MSTLWQTYQIHEQSKHHSQTKNDPSISENQLTPPPPPPPAKNQPPQINLKKNLTPPPLPPKKTKAS